VIACGVYMRAIIKKHPVNVSGDVLANIMPKALEKYSLKTWAYAVCFQILIVWDIQ
jgi:hypothetical protein